MPASRLRNDSDCVSFLSIHSSKGLEYPVVFLVSAGNKLNVRLDGDIVTAGGLGAGAIIRDRKNHREFSSFYRNAAAVKNERDEKDEYMRLLYVALTRARNRLYITAAVPADSAEYDIRRACLSNGCPTDSDVYSSSSFFSWIMYGIADAADAAPFRAFAGVPTNGGADGSLFYGEVIPLYDRETCAVTKTEPPKREYIDPAYAEQLISRRYAHIADVCVPSKLSVSEIKRKSSLPSRAPVPAFMQNGVTGADRGNATHLFLQFCDFTAVHDEQSLECEIGRLLRCEFISRRDSELIEREKVIRFLKSDIMQRAIADCKKEERLMFSLPARSVTDIDSDEPVAIQCVLDLWYTENGRAVIIDYKTDRVKTENELISRYAVQLELYATALKQNYGLETAHKYIYSFCLERFIEIK